MTVVDLHLVVPSGDLDRVDPTGVVRYEIPGSAFMPLAVGAAKAARVEFDAYGDTPDFTLTGVVCEWCTELKMQGPLRHATFADAHACWDTRKYQHEEAEAELPLILLGLI